MSCVMQRSISVSQTGGSAYASSLFVQSPAQPSSVAHAAHVPQHTSGASSTPSRMADVTAPDCTSMSLMTRPSPIA